MHWKFKCFQYGDPLLFLRPPSPPGRQAQISGDARQDLIRAARKCLDGKETSENTWKGGWLVWILRPNFCSLITSVVWSFVFSWCDQIQTWFLFGRMFVTGFCDIFSQNAEVWMGKWKALRCLGSTTLHSSCKLRGYRVTSDMSMQPFATHRYTFRINKKKTQKQNTGEQFVGSICIFSTKQF